MVTIFEAFYQFVAQTLSEEKFTEKEKDKQIDKIKSGFELAEIFLHGTEMTADAATSNGHKA